MHSIWEMWRDFHQQNPWLNTVTILIALLMVFLSLGGFKGLKKSLDNIKELKRADIPKILLKLGLTVVIFVAITMVIMTIIVSGNNFP